MTADWVCDGFGMDVWKIEQQKLFWETKPREELTKKKRSERKKIFMMKRANQTD